MADITIGDIRKQYPQYSDLSDMDLAKGLHDKFYSDMPFDEFASKINLTGAGPEIKPDQYPKLAAVADVPLSVGRGMVSGIQMISDAFGANNPVSKTLSSVDTTLADLMSAQSKKDSREIARIMAEAQDKGIYEQVKAGLKALSIAPVDLLTNALGTAAPVIVGGLLSEFAAPAVAGAIGVSEAAGLGAAELAAGTAKVAGTLSTATELGMGAVGGAGTIKNRIHDDVFQALKDQGVPDDKAEAAAQQAQAYNGKNLDNILLGAVLGAGASATGLEKTLVKSMSSKILGNAAKEAATAIEEQAGKGAGTRLAEGFVKEAIPEAEQISSNVAQQREGMDVPTYRGAVGAGVLAGIAGGVLGGGMDVALGHGPRTVDKVAEDEHLLNALRTHQADVQAGKETPLLEDVTGNKLFGFAESQREKIPVLGEILDSNAPRDVKMELIQNRLREANLGNTPEDQINLKGVLSLPAPEIRKSENIRQVFNNALDIADQSNTSLADLTVNQGPEGFRIVSPDGKVISDPMPMGTEREANMVLEGLRRTHDARQTEAYRSASEEYRKNFDQSIAEATAAAAREVTTPMQPVTLAKIADLNPDLADQIRESRRTDPTVESKAEIEAPVSFEELNRRGASRQDQIELAREQKPYTGNTGQLLPDTERNILGPRPLEPKQVARTPEELEKMKLADVTQGGAEFSRAEKAKPVSEEEASPVGTAPVKPARSEREAYPEIPAAPRPSTEAVTQARQLIEDRIAKVEASGKQGAAIGKGVRDAVADSNFTPEQLVNAFKIADISARLLGKTEADPHAFQFVQRIATPTGETAGGARIAPQEKLQGIIKMSLDPKYDPRSTTAHESFHVLQDLFAAYDKAGSTVINNAFKGAKSFDDIDTNLLRKLKSLRDPDTKSSVYDRLKQDVEEKGLLEGYDQATREREMQAYVFGYMDNAITNGNQNTSGLGAPFVRFLNYFRNLKDRVGNYFKGLGYQTAEDVMGTTTRGTRQAGLGVAGEQVSKVLPGAGFEFSNAIARTGQEQESRIKSERFDNVMSSVKEFFNPLANVNNVSSFMSFRNIAMGSVTTSEQYARKMADRIAKGSVEERQAVYKYMTTRNTPSSTIKDADIREAAVEAKKRINEIAQLMVARKELTQESLDKYYDQYLPRIYLAYEATGRGMKSPMGGKSVQEYLKMRDEDLSEDYRKVLGEIKDPSYLAYVALSRPLRDMAMTDFLNNISIFGGDPANRWIAPQSWIEYTRPGSDTPKKYTPYQLLHMAEDLHSVAKIAENLDTTQAEAMRSEADKLTRLATDAISELKPQIKDIEASGYKQMPDARQYGPLAGAMVQKGIYQDLVGTFIPVGKENRSLVERVFGDEHSKVGQVTALWKLGKTTLNPPTQVKNFISNAIALNLFGGVPIHQFPTLFNRALKEMMNNGKMWQEAQKYGISGGTMSSAELKKAFIRLQRYQGKTEGENTLVNMYASARAIGSTFVEKAGDAYQFSEALFKMMKYIHGRETEKLNPSDAVNSANDVLFDYSLVNNNIRWLRNAPIGLPFITYYYKMVPKFIETLYKHPERFIPYVAMAYAIPAMTMASMDLSDDELEKLRKSAQEYIRDKGSLYILPMRDSKGNIQIIDAGGFIPFSALTDPIVTALKYGEYGKAAKDAAQPLIPSGPVVTAIAALATGNDPFTGKPIMDPRDTNKAQWLAMTSFLWNQAMPPMLSMDLNKPENSSGALPRLYNSLFVDGTGVDRKGQPKPEVLESAARMLGFNLTPLKADTQRMININYMMNQINKTKSLQTMTASDKSMTPDARREKMLELADKIKEQNQELVKYASETQGIGAITEKIRNKP